MASFPGFIWLDSAVTQPGSVSILTAWPDRILRGKMSDDWSQVETVLQEGITAGKPGGLYGWVGYDGQFVLGVYPHALLYDHESNEWFDCGGFWQKWQSEAPFEPAPFTQNTPEIPFQALVSKENFLAQVRRAQDYIRAGDIYQVNLSHPWRASWPPGTPFLPLYQRLRQVSPAPHAACLNLEGTTLFSASPELFLKLSGRTIATHPIKGTRPRYPQDPPRDAASARDLLACDKERAELLMITDLERNDLGQVCEFGSVQVPDLWRVESFAQVYHLVSTVIGVLRPGISHASAFRACFPGGSITGAPKKRAREIISELEPYPRGLYTGAIGFFGFDGESQWSIAIRTAVKKGDEITFHAGSGIVADSIAEKEWEETYHKASGILAAWSQPNQ
ncbi:anthranilate synthase component I family protein [Prosthecobacter fusiformis]|uniref:anthranilate synthase component I family protein n=1 Tax=Prosthecobacter fusiformis TaxID=48464 RepID=UPI001414E431|nr:anthranilate synthase component I family protein [Prosthecobacter fusiformis]